MKRRQRARRFIGLVPSLWRGGMAVGRWLLHRPQPLLLGAGLIAGSVWIWGYMQRTDAFRIARVALPVEASLKVPESVIGENLWRLDLGALAERLHQQQPSLKEVRVIRQLPNTLCIEPVKREPVAQVRLDLPAPLARQAGRWYPVDREGFILPEPASEPSERLVRITGFEHASGLRAGKDNADERLQLALRVLGVLRRSPLVMARRLTELNVAEPQQIRFTLGETTEVRCGAETELNAHLERLRAALKAIAKRPLATQYIDVRFPEPVIAPKP